MGTIAYDVNGVSKEVSIADESFIGRSSAELKRSLIFALKLPLVDQPTHSSRTMEQKMDDILEASGINPISVKTLA